MTGSKQAMVRTPVRPLPGDEGESPSWTLRAAASHCCLSRSASYFMQGIASRDSLRASPHRLEGQRSFIKCTAARVRSLLAADVATRRLCRCVFVQL